MWPLYISLTSQQILFILVLTSHKALRKNHFWLVCPQAVYRLLIDVAHSHGQHQQLNFYQCWWNRFVRLWPSYRLAREGGSSAEVTHFRKWCAEDRGISHGRVTIQWMCCLLSWGGRERSGEPSATVLLAATPSAAPAVCLARIEIYSASALKQPEQFKVWS